MEYSLDGNIRLMAQDLRTARTRLGITSGQAAKRAGLNATYYRRLETGLVPKNQHVLRKLFSVCQRMGMESVRVAHVDEIDQYLHLDLWSDPSRGRMIAFRDAVEANVANLHDLRCFLSPDTICGFLERAGSNATAASRNSVDKRMMELLFACVLILCLDQDKDYYVRPVKDDPPDVELLGVNRDGSLCPVAGVEITRHGKYSQSLFDVIGKKLAKRYEKGTMLVVVVEERETVDIPELAGFIRDRNPHGQRLVVIGGTGQTGKFLAVPWDHVSSPNPDEADWIGLDVDLRDRGTGFRGYRGVFWEETGWWGLRGWPLFVRNVVLNR